MRSRWRLVVAYIVIAYIVMAYIVMACIVMACIVMAYIVMAYIVMVHIDMACIVMACIVMVLIHESETSLILLAEDIRQKSIDGAKNKNSGWFFTVDDHTEEVEQKSEKVAIKLMKNEEEWQREQDMRMSLSIDVVVKILDVIVDQKAMDSGFKDPRPFVIVMPAAQKVTIAR